MPLAGKPMVEWSIAAFRAVGVRSIVVACPPGHSDELPGDDLLLVAGGKTRSESVSNALEMAETELVAVHDAARPLVTAALIQELIETLIQNPDVDGIIPATPAADTIKWSEVNKGRLIVGSTFDRDRLWGAQTPQVFPVVELRGALAGDPARVAAATDDAMLVEMPVGRVLIHPSSPENFKVTTPLDLRVAEMVLSERSAQ